MKILTNLDEIIHGTRVNLVKIGLGLHEPGENMHEIGSTIDENSHEHLMKICENQKTHYTVP